MPSELDGFFGFRKRKLCKAVRKPGINVDEIADALNQVVYMTEEEFALLAEEKELEEKIRNNPIPKIEFMPRTKEDDDWYDYEEEEGEDADGFDGDNMHNPRSIPSVKPMFCGGDSEEVDHPSNLGGEFSPVPNRSDHPTASSAPDTPHGGAAAEEEPGKKTPKSWKIAESIPGPSGGIPTLNNRRRRFHRSAGGSSTTMTTTHQQSLINTSIPDINNSAVFPTVGSERIQSGSNDGLTNQEIEKESGHPRNAETVQHSISSLAAGSFSEPASQQRYKLSSSASSSPAADPQQSSSTLNPRLAPSVPIMGAPKTIITTYCQQSTESESRKSPISFLDGPKQYHLPSPRWNELFSTDQSYGNVRAGGPLNSDDFEYSMGQKYATFDWAMEVENHHQQHHKNGPPPDDDIYTPARRRAGPAKTSNTPYYPSMAKNSPGAAYGYIDNGQEGHSGPTHSQQMGERNAVRKVSGEAAAAGRRNVVQPTRSGSAAESGSLTGRGYETEYYCYNDTRSGSRSRGSSDEPFDHWYQQQQQNPLPSAAVTSSHNILQRFPSPLLPIPPGFEKDDFRGEAPPPLEHGDDQQRHPSDQRKKSPKLAVVRDSTSTVGRHGSQGQRRRSTIRRTRRCNPPPPRLAAAVAREENRRGRSRHHQEEKERHRSQQEDRNPPLDNGRRRQREDGGNYQLEEEQEFRSSSSSSYYPSSSNNQCRNDVRREKSKATTIGVQVDFVLEKEQFTVNHNSNPQDPQFGGENDGGASATMVNNNDQYFSQPQYHQNHPPMTMINQIYMPPSVHQFQVFPDPWNPSQVIVQSVVPIMPPQPIYDSGLNGPPMLPPMMIPEYQGLPDTNTVQPFQQSQQQFLMIDPGIVYYPVPPQMPATAVKQEWFHEEQQNQPTTNMAVPAALAVNSATPETKNLRLTESRKVINNNDNQTKQFEQNNNNKQKESLTKSSDEYHHSKISPISTANAPSSGFRHTSKKPQKSFSSHSRPAESADLGGFGGFSGEHDEVVHSSTASKPSSDFGFDGFLGDTELPPSKPPTIVEKHHRRHPSPIHHHRHHQSSTPAAAKRSSAKPPSQNHKFTPSAAFHYHPSDFGGFLGDNGHQLQSAHPAPVRRRHPSDSAFGGFLGEDETLPSDPLAAVRKQPSNSGFGGFLGEDEAKLPSTPPPAANVRKQPSGSGFGGFLSERNKKRPTAPSAPIAAANRKQPSDFEFGGFLGIDELPSEPVVVQRHHHGRHQSPPFQGHRQSSKTPVKIFTSKPPSSHRVVNRPCRSGTEFVVPAASKLSVPAGDSGKPDRSRFIPPRMLKQRAASGVQGVKARPKPPTEKAAFKTHRRESCLESFDDGATRRKPNDDTELAPNSATAAASAHKISKQKTSVRLLNPSQSKPDEWKSVPTKKSKKGPSSSSSPPTQLKPDDQGKSSEQNQPKSSLENINNPESALDVDVWI